MSELTSELKSIFTKYKHDRDEAFAEAYNGRFMVNFMLAAAFVTGLNWYNDDITCIIPDFTGLQHSFVSQNCWINGLYIYKELSTSTAHNGYYGIPTDTTHNGTDGIMTCISLPTRNSPYRRRKSKPSNCKAMTKEFYIHYQYFPFYLASLSIIFYLPRLLSHTINEDLRKFEKDTTIFYEGLENDVIKEYFQLMPKRKVTRKWQNYIPLVSSLLIDLLFILSNLFSMEITNNLLNNNFKPYGREWFTWTTLENSVAFGYLDTRRRSIWKPTEVLLPTFGFCDVFEEHVDVKMELINEHVVLCEMSQNILYHYVLIALWVLLVLGIVVSAIGMCDHLLSHCIRSCYFADNVMFQSEVFWRMTFRQREFLDNIRKTNISLYWKVTRKLYKTYKEDG